MKLRYGFFLVILVVLVTGCGKNSLKCVYESDSNDSVVNMKFNKDGITFLKEKDVQKYSDDDAYVEMFYYEQVDKFVEIDNVSGVKYDIKKRNSNVYTNLNIDYKALGEYDSDIIIVDKNNDYDSSKSIFEDLGYSCK